MWVRIETSSTHARWTHCACANKKKAAKVRLELLHLGLHAVVYPTELSTRRVVQARQLLMSTNWLVLSGFGGNLNSISEENCVWRSHSCSDAKNNKRIKIKKWKRKGSNTQSAGLVAGALPLSHRCTRIRPREILSFNANRKGEKWRNNTQEHKGSRFFSWCRIWQSRSRNQEGRLDGGWGICYSPSWAWASYTFSSDALRPQTRIRFQHHHDEIEAGLLESGSE